MRRMMILIAGFVLATVPPAVAQGWYETMQAEQGQVYGDDSPVMMGAGSSGDGDGGGADGGGADGGGGSSAGGSGPSIAPPPVDPTSHEARTLIAEWLRTAIPVQNKDGARLRYDQYGRMVGRSCTATITANQPPSPLAGPTPEAHAWSFAGKLKSLNLCTLKEYVELRLAEASTIHCSIGTQGGSCPGGDTPSPPVGTTTAEPIDRAEACNRRLPGSTPISVGDGFTCKCRHGTAVDNGRQVCAGMRTPPEQLSPSDQRAHCERKVRGSEPLMLGTALTCACPRGTSLDQTSKSCVTPAPQPGAIDGFAGTYACTGGFERIRFPGRTPGRTGFYSSTYDRSHEGVITVHPDTGQGRWEEPAVNRFGELSNVRVTSNGFSGEYRVKPGQGGSYQGRHLPERQGRFSCTKISDNGERGGGTPPPQPPSQPPGVLSGPVGPGKPGRCSSTFNLMTITGAHRGIVARYENDQSLITGQWTGNRMAGHWSEPSAAEKCATQRNGTFYWGGFTADFSGDGFTGKWSYCSKPPSREWKGWDCKGETRGTINPRPTPPVLSPAQSPDQPSPQTPVSGNQTLAPGYYAVRKSGTGYRKYYGGMSYVYRGFHIFVIRIDPKAKGVRGNSFYTTIGGDTPVQAAIAQWQQKAREATRKSCAAGPSLCPCPPDPSIWTDGPHYQVIGGPYEKSADVKAAHGCDKQNRGRICIRWTSEKRKYSDAQNICQRMGY